jgi:hypothetical protein
MVKSQNCLEPVKIWYRFRYLLREQSKHNKKHLQKTDEDKTMKNVLRSILFKVYRLGLQMS